MRKLLPIALSVGALSLITLSVSVRLQAPVNVPSVFAGKPIKSWTGTASWYGPGFHGRTTASGQTYDMYAATAAHPWLPLGSVVRVVNLTTGESQVARINDRGPYFGGRELDVSYMLASRLGILEPGTASVRIELLEQPQRRPQTP
jgi:rare lipoprotein A (peptidoglycan hydrolase)